MIFAFEGLPIRPATGFQWLRKTPRFARLTSTPPSLWALFSTLPDAGLGCRPGSFEQRIPVPRQRTPNHGASLFFYRLARTTLLCNPVRRSAKCCNCEAIGPIGSSSAVWQAGLLRRLGAYYRHRPTRWPTYRSRFRASWYQSGDASTASAACEIPGPTPRKA
jgi:hypothetical protein